MHQKDQIDALTLYNTFAEDEEKESEWNQDDDSPYDEALLRDDDLLGEDLLVEEEDLAEAEATDLDPIGKSNGDSIGDGDDADMTTLDGDDDDILAEMSQDREGFLLEDVASTLDHTQLPPVSPLKMGSSSPEKKKIPASPVMLGFSIKKQMMGKSHSSPKPKKGKATGPNQSPKQASSKTRVKAQIPPNEETSTPAIPSDQFETSHVANELPPKPQG